MEKQVLSGILLQYTKHHVTIRGAKDRKWVVAKMVARLTHD